MPAFELVPIERVRAFWDARPCNVRHSPKPVGSREYFDEVEARKYLVEPHIPGFAAFERWAGRRVLELGCGIGTDTISFARAGAEVTAVDLSEASLALARRRAEVYGLMERIRLVEGNIEELPSFLAEEPFDLVYAFGVVHHTPHPERVLDHLPRYLAPGGTVKLMVYHRRSWKVLSILLREGRGRLWRLDERVAAHSEAQTGCPVTYTYTRAGARRLLEARGLRVTSLEVEHVFPWRVEDYREHRYVKTRWARSLPRPLFRLLERTVGWHLLVTAEAR